MGSNGNGEREHADESPTPRWRTVDFASMPTEQALGIVHSALHEIDDRCARTHQLAAMAAGRAQAIRDQLSRYEQTESDHHAAVLRHFSKLERRLDNVISVAHEAKGAAERSGSHPQIVLVPKHDSEPPNPVKEWAKRNRRTAGLLGVLATLIYIAVEVWRHIPG